MSDAHDYHPKRAPREDDERYPPKQRGPKTELGQDYFTMLEKHGRPYGPFDKERVLPYRGA
jgi:hypothetical protein